MDEEKKTIDTEQPEEDTYRLSDGTVRQVRMEAPPPDPEKIAQEKQEKKAYTKGLIRAGIVFGVLVLALVLVRVFLLEPVRVDGVSMLYTLETDEYVLVSSADFWQEGPRRMDIVQCMYPEQKQSFIKRVIGLPGDVVEVRTGVLYINGEETPQPFVTTPYDEDFGPETVEADHYLVMGDNRNQSMDSRDARVGQIPKENIMGLARAVIYPFSKIHMLPRGE